MMMMMMMMGIRMMPVVICLPQRLIHALVLQPPFPRASPFEEKGSADKVASQTRSKAVKRSSPRERLPLAHVAALRCCQVQSANLRKRNVISRSLAVLEWKFARHFTVWLVSQCPRRFAREA